MQLPPAAVFLDAASLNAWMLYWLGLPAGVDYSLDLTRLTRQISLDYLGRASTGLHAPAL